MTIDHLFHFFGMHLETPNINNSIAPADEVVAIVSQVEHVGGVDKTVRILQWAVFCIQVAARRPARTGSKRTILDLHIHARCTPEHTRGKPGEAVIHVKGNPGFRGGKTHDRCVRAGKPAPDD